MASHSRDQLDGRTLLVYTCRGLEIRKDDNSQEFREVVCLCEGKELRKGGDSPFADSRTGVLKKWCKDNKRLWFEIRVGEVDREARNENRKDGQRLD